MAGYLLALEKESDVRLCVERGVYSTLMNPNWTGPTSATLGDYVTMRPGDNIYFFSHRRIYGIGEIEDLGGGKAVAENFPVATSGFTTTVSVAMASSQLPNLNSDAKVARWLVEFKPAPAFFKDGVDMDDMLSSNPQAFRSLRVFWSRSFIKLDDDENMAFKTAILRANLDAFPLSCVKWQPSMHVTRAVTPKVPQLLSNKRKKNGSLSNEMLLEVGLLYQLTIGDPQTISVFGSWDYLSHQVHASPAKPVNYMDKMDIFGYRWIPGFRPIVGRYLMAELKKDRADGDDIPQCMKYVDWVSNEYTHQDYSLVEAFLVAFDFERSSFYWHREEVRRNFVIGQHHPVARQWKQLTLVSYSVESNGHIHFEKLSWPPRP